jgi:transposase
MPTDARSLSPAARQAIRDEVVAAVRQGKSQTAVSTEYRVARRTVLRWLAEAREKGEHAPAANRPGRPRDSGRIRPSQKRTSFFKIIAQQLNSGEPWTRERVQRIAIRYLEVDVSVWTIGRQLRSHGITLKRGRPRLPLDTRTTPLK